MALRRQSLFFEREGGHVLASSKGSNSQDPDLQHRVRYPGTLWASIVIGCGAIIVLVLVPDRLWSDWDPEVIEAKVKLFALCLVCMGLAVNLLTLNPFENRHKRNAYHVIIVAGFVAGFALFSPESDWVTGFLLWAILPVVVAYGRVVRALFCSMYRKQKPLLALLSLGALLIPAGIALPYFDQLGTVPHVWRESIVVVGLILSGLFLILEKQHRTQSIP